MPGITQDMIAQMIADAVADALKPSDPATPARKGRKPSASKATPAQDAPTVPTIIRWRKTVACKPGATFPHTLKSGDAVTYRRLTLAQAVEAIEAVYAAGGFYASRA